MSITNFYCSDTFLGAFSLDLKKELDNELITVKKKVQVKKTNFDILPFSFQWESLMKPFYNYHMEFITCGSITEKIILRVSKYKQHFTTSACVLHIVL